MYSLIQAAREESHFSSRCAAGCSNDCKAASISPSKRPKSRSSSGACGRTLARRVPFKKLSSQTSRFEPSAAIVSEKSSPLRFGRSEEHTSELQSRGHLVCRLLLEKKKLKQNHNVSSNDL